MKTILNPIQKIKNFGCVETTDSKKICYQCHNALESLQPSFSFLLASKRLQKCTGKAIKNVVLNTLQKCQLLMFLIDDATTMPFVSCSNKNES